jgi:long-chain acyl-CoA synthetase
MDKIWLKSYPPGIPAEIDTHQHQSIVSMLDKRIQMYGDLPAYSNFGKCLSFAELGRSSLAFASYLQQNLKLKKGDRIAIMLPNLLQYPIALFGALRAGLIVVNTNPLYTEHELKHQLSDSGAVVIVILENFAKTLEKILPDTAVKHIITTQLGDCLGFPKSFVVNTVVKYVKHMVPAFSLPNAVSFNKALGKAAQQTFVPVEIASNDIAFLQYTGGTTGVPKAAMIAHSNIIANMLQAGEWASADLVRGGEVFITALPLYHIFSLTANALFGLEIGAKNVLITNPKDLPSFIKTLGQEKFSYISGVNTLFNALLAQKEFCKLDFSHLVLTLGGGMAVQQHVAEKWQQVTGCMLYEAYGLTEASPAVCVNPLTLDHFNGCIGLPIPSTEVEIRDEEGNALACDQVGELWVRGPQVMQGYWQREEETSEVLTSDGWLRTGDAAVMYPDGFVKIVDRLKDMIIVSGFNVFSNEVEDVIARHEKVREVGVVGIADEHSGEAVRAFIVKEDSSLQADEVIDYCREHLTRYKCPRSVVFLDELPKTNVGKVLRRALRDLAN